MKTIEQRADIYEEISGCYGCQLGQVKEAFIAGARSEHSELTKWNSPECPPDDRRPVLLKMTNAVNGLIRYAVASYIAGRFLCPEMLPKNEILGWREIHE